MKRVETGNCEYEKVPRLARRDLILLPVVSLFTIALMVIPTELIARRMFYASKTSLDDCLISNGAASGVVGRPDSVCEEKAPEDQLTEYRFDSCGYRSGMACGPKSPGTYRIVMTGSSLAMGERVPINKTLAALLPENLSRRTDRKIELYNEGMAYGFARNTALRFNDVLAAQPDLVLWVLTPLDVSRAAFVFGVEKFKKADPESSIGLRMTFSGVKNSVMGTLHEYVGNVRTGYALRHFLYEYESQNQYIKSYLMSSDEESGFLRAQLSPEWKAHLREFDEYAADVEEKAREASVPLVAVLVPNRAQAAMISLGEWPAGFDPYTFNNELRSIIISHGGTYVDILPDFRAISNPEQYYYPIDGHPNSGGHAIIARMLAKELTSGVIAGLRVEVDLQLAMGRGK